MDNYWHAKFNPLFNPYQMITDFNAPILKRTCFSCSTMEWLELSVGGDVRKSFEYIQDHTDYDVSMIWEYIIRQLNPKQLTESLNLTYILPHTYGAAAYTSQKRIAVLAHIYYNDPDKIEVCFSYLRNIPASVDLYITTSSAETMSLIQSAIRRYHIKNCQVIMIGNRGRELRGMLVECADLFNHYEYVCFVHDKKTTGGIQDPEPGDSFMYLLWDNLLKSEYFINNVLDTFEKNPYLGFLTPPPPYHWGYFSSQVSWCGNFDNTKKLAEELGLNCVMSREILPFTIGMAYWCRTLALRPLLDHAFQPENFPPEPIKLDGTIGHAIERIFAFAVQSAGYATGIVMNDEYAALHLSNYEECVNVLAESSSRRLRPATVRALYAKCRDVYIYGAGEEAGYVLKDLEELGLKPRGLYCIRWTQSRRIFLQLPNMGAVRAGYGAGPDGDHTCAEHEKPTAGDACTVGKAVHKCIPDM